MSRSLSSRSRALLALPAAASVLVLLAACSSGSDTTSTGSDTATSNSQPAGGDRMPGGGGVSGEIAEVSDTLMQVQGDDGQTAVSWDDSTTISQTVSAALSDVTVGVCVSAVLDDDDLATSITISEPVDGECTGGVGLGGGGGMPQGGELPDGAPTGMPEGEAPADMPTDAPDGGGSGGDFGQVTSGLVTAVDGSTLTIDAVSMGRPGDDSADASTASTVVTVADTTTYTATAAADATAITVGRCVVAQGDQDDSGQMTATSLTVSDATDGSCSTGFGGRPQGGDDSDA